MGQQQHMQMAPPERARTRRRIASLALVGVAGVVLGIGLGIAGAWGSSASVAGTGDPRLLASGQPGTPTDAQGIARAQGIVAAVLEAAPACQPEIRMAGAPAGEREEFLREAEELAGTAAREQGLHNVVWRVIERDGRLYGVLYGERCD